MKKSVSVIFGGLLCASILSVSLISSFKNESKDVEGYSTSTLPTTIDLNDTSASNIRSYYSSLNNLSQSERQGNNLLKNLKTILKNGQKYYSYDSGNAIWQIYEISDRDWEKSPASSTTYGTYNSSTKKITNYTYGTSSSSSKNNPYIHALYINRDVTNQTTAWDDHQQTQWGINREHVWPKAEGFETSGAGGARGDPMHLMAGNGYANNIHSNYYYGYVNTSSSYTNCGSKYSNVSGNLLGKSKTLGGSTNVFEPQDSDKGDIARAIFYMVARYNYLSGSDSDGIDSNNPNLALTQQLSDWASSGYSSTTSKKGYMGIMTDLLAWHHADPVDEYEIHRNNILYTNYTNNRNPFIDFPEWADFIWGSVNYSGSTYISHSTTPTGYATPSSDTINGYNSGGGSTVSVTGVTLDENSIEVEEGSDATLTATVAPSNATNQTVTWSTSDPSVATVSGGIVTGVKEGSATITVTTSDGGYTDSCTVTVTEKSGGGGDEDTTTASVSIADYADDHSWSSSTKYTTVNIDSIVTATASGGSNTGKYYTTGEEWRFYQSESGSVTISVPTGYSLDSVTFTYAIDKTGILLDKDNNIISSGSSVSLSGSSATFHVGNTSTATNGQVKFTAISVTYHAVELPTSIVASVDKTFYVGETITKSDITVEDDLGNEITDFQFDDYMFTYEDASSGGSTSEKDFDIEYSGSATEYLGMETTLIVDVERKAFATITPSWKKVTDASTLSVNDKIIIADSAQNVALSTEQRSANRGAATITKSNNTITWSSGTYVPQELTLTSTNDITDAPTGSFGLYTGSGYLYAAASNQNQLKTRVTNNIDGAFVITISEGIATICATESNNRPLMRSNYSNNPSIFSCYEKGSVTGNSLEIYKYYGETALNVSNYIMYEDTANQCTSKLSVAIGYLNNLSSSELTTFTTSNDYVISTARERLEAWARSQGKSVNYTANDVTLQSNNTVSLYVGSPEANNMIVILLVASLLCSTALTTVIVVKKRKRMM